MKQSPTCLGKSFVYVTSLCIMAFMSDTHCPFTGCKNLRRKVTKPYYSRTEGRERTVNYLLKYCEKHQYLNHVSAAQGTKKVTLQGYVVVKTGKIWRPEHQLIMEQMLDRKLLPGESVHHKDGNRSNNNPSNLELWIGTIRYGQRATDMLCPHCHLPYLTQEEMRNNAIQSTELSK